MKTTMTLMLSKLGEILLSLLGTDAVKRIIITKLVLLSKKTDNSIDDLLVKLIESALYNTKDVETLTQVYGQWTGLSLSDVVKVIDATKNKWVKVWFARRPGKTASVRRLVTQTYWDHVALELNSYIAEVDVDSGWCLELRQRSKTGTQTEVWWWCG